MDSLDYLYIIYRQDSYSLQFGMGIGYPILEGVVVETFHYLHQYLARHISSSIYNTEHRSSHSIPLLSFSFLPFPLLTLRRMAEAKKKQADTNKDKDTDTDTEAVHDGTGIVRYAHHASIHTSKHTYIHTYIHIHIYA